MVVVLTYGQRLQVLKSFSLEQYDNGIIFKVEGTNGMSITLEASRVVYTPQLESLINTIMQKIVDLALQGGVTAIPYDQLLNMLKQQENPHGVYIHEGRLSTTSFKLNAEKHGETCKYIYVCNQNLEAIFLTSVGFKITKEQLGLQPIYSYSLLGERTKVVQFYPYTSKDSQNIHPTNPNITHENLTNHLNKLVRSEMNSTYLINLQHILDVITMSMGYESLFILVRD